MLNIFGGAFTKRDARAHLDVLGTQIHTEVEKIDNNLNKSKKIIARFEADRKVQLSRMKGKLQKRFQEVS